MQTLRVGKNKVVISSDQISLINFGLNDAAIFEWVEEIESKCPNQVIRLDVTCNNLTKVGAQNLALLTPLKDLVVDSNKLGDEGLTALLGCRNLRSLSIRNNNLTDVGAEILLEKLRQPANKLTHVDIGQNPKISLSIIQAMQTVPGVNIIYDAPTTPLGIDLGEVWDGGNVHAMMK